MVIDRTPSVPHTNRHPEPPKGDLDLYSSGQGLGDPPHHRYTCLSLIWFLTTCKMILPSSLFIYNLVVLIVTVT